MHQTANNLMLTYYYLVPSIIGWVMGMASGLQKPLSIISRLSFGTSEEKKLEQRCFPNINHVHAAKIDHDLQTRPSEEPNRSSVWICRKSVQRFPRYLPKTPFFVHGDLDLWSWYSNSSKWGTKHIFPVNLAQIRSPVPEMFHTQKKVTVSKTEP